MMKNKMYRQRGAALLVSMLILLILTLIGVGGMQTAGFEERMAGNLQDYQLAFEAAEEALKMGEAQLGTQLYLPESYENAGPNQIFARDYLFETYGTNWWFNASVASSWWAASATSVAAYGSLAAAGDSPYVAEVPRFVVEEVSVGRAGENLGIGDGYVEKDSGRQFHRITARGVGGRSSTVVLLQSTYVKRYN